MALTGKLPFHRSIAVNHLSQVGEARRAIQLEATFGGFDEIQGARLAIVATEIATNIARYTRGGELLYRYQELPWGPAIEVLGVDRGPGMADPERCLSDGYSSRGTPGNGLGAIRRQSDEFEFYSTVEGGSVVMARVAARKLRGTVEESPLRLGSVCAPHPGEPVCGDTWRVRWTADGFSLIVADGLGHGILAAEAAAAAMESFEASPSSAPAELVERIHEHIHGTRGCAVAVADFDAKQKNLSYSGIGNIAGRLVSGGKNRGLISLNGTAGVQAAKIQQFEYEWPADALLIMHSDGLQTRWELDAYPGITVRHPAITAAAVYRDFNRGRDDVTVVAANWSRANRSRS